MSSVYEIVQGKILDQIAKGVIPWRRPWISGQAVSWKTGKPYRGINQFILDPGEYATFSQITEAGGRVKKGSKGSIVVFWKMDQIENDEGEMENRVILRYYKVFNVKTQTEGLNLKQQEVSFTHNPIESGEKIISMYADKPAISFKPGKACYIPSTDHISIPDKSDFPQIEEYYSTLFHELVHSTGHQSRLNRKGITEMTAFGSENYGKEELIAELGAAMLCGVARINNTLENSAAYLAGWARAIKGDVRLVVMASAAAQKAADYIQGIKF
jgi:antirestriction protein ArdC